MIRRQDALDYHAAERAGKIEIRASMPCLTPRDMRLAYLPGAGFPAEEIARDPSAVFRYTSRANLVGVITNGTAVPGLGHVGPLAAKPMQEGMAVLFKRLADIDVFDLEQKMAPVQRIDGLSGVSGPGQGFDHDLVQAEGFRVGGASVEVVDAQGGGRIGLDRQGGERHQERRQRKGQLGS